MPDSQALPVHPTACHLAASSTAPHCSYIHGHQLRSSSQSLLQQDLLRLPGVEHKEVPRGAGPDAVGLPGGVPRGPPRSAGPDTSHGRLISLQQHLRQSAAQTQAALPAASKPLSGLGKSIPRDGQPLSRNGKKAFKACADHTEQVTRTPTPLAFPRLAVHQAATVKRSPAEHHGKVAMQEAPLVTQQLPEKLASAEHQQKQSAAECHEKLAMQEASLVSLQLPEKLLLPPEQVTNQAQLLFQLLLSVTQQLHAWKLVMLVPSC